MGGRWEQVFGKVADDVEGPSHSTVVHSGLAFGLRSREFIQNQIDFAMDKGREEGREEGIKKGIEKGIEKGLEQGREKNQRFIEILKSKGVPEELIEQALTEC